MSSRSIDESILTVKDVAQYLKVNDRTVYRLAVAKKIPAFKVGGIWRFLRSDIDLWIKNQTAGADGMALTSGLEMDELAKNEK